MSLRTFAAHLGVAVASVTNWEKRGTRIRLRHETQQLLDLDFNRAGDDVRERFWAVIGTRPGDADTTPGYSATASFDLNRTAGHTRADEQEEVRRLVSHATAVTMGSAGREVTNWSQPIDRQVAPAPAHIGLSDVEYVESLTTAMRAMDYRHGGGACRDAVAAGVRWAQQLLDATCHDEVRSRLHLALADLHNLAGWTSFDVGMYSVAGRHLTRALEQAKYADDQSLTANILYRMGRLHLHRGLNRQALHFFQLGQVAADGSGCNVTIAMLYANEAWAHALLGNGQRLADRILRAQYQFANADHSISPAWVRFFGDADLHATIGVALSSQSNPSQAQLAEAISHIERAIEQRGPDMKRSRVFEATALAVCYLRAGYPDRGLQAGREAVAAAATVRSKRTLDRLQPLQALTGGRTADNDLRDLGHHIHNLRTSA